MHSYNSPIMQIQKEKSGIFNRTSLRENAIFYTPKMITDKSRILKNLIKNYKKTGADIKYINFL
ncbi:MAG TPA: hypothetical protein DCF70_06740 [Treponema sp.]|nr:hypothetical protein [Treponema sp.]